MINAVANLLDVTSRPPILTVFFVRAARSLIRFFNACSGRPSSLHPLPILVRAAEERTAGATIERRSVPGPSGSWSTKSMGARACSMCLRT